MDVNKAYTCLYPQLDKWNIKEQSVPEIAWALRNPSPALWPWVSQADVDGGRWRWAKKIGPDVFSKKIADSLKGNQEKWWCNDKVIVH